MLMTFDYLKFGKCKKNPKRIVEGVVTYSKIVDTHF